MILFVRHKFYHFRELTFKRTNYIFFYCFKIKRRIVISSKLLINIRSCPLWVLFHTSAFATNWLFVCVYGFNTILFILLRFSILWIKRSFFFCWGCYCQDFLNLLAVSPLRSLRLNWNLKNRLRSNTLLRYMLRCSNFYQLGISPFWSNDFFI